MEAPPSPELHIEWVYSPLPPADVRWYSYRAAWSEAELVKAPEVPHRAHLLRFCAADSLGLEAAFRRRHDELERCWWEEEAQLHTRGNGGGGAAAATSSSPSAAATAAAAAAVGTAAEAAGEGAAAPAAAAAAVEASASTLDWAYFCADCGGEEPGVLVRSGAWEVDLKLRQLRPCYWPAAAHRCLRGTWFAEKAGEWVPLKESLAEQLEEGYRQALWLPARGRLAAQPGGGYAARLDLTTHVEKRLYALFASEEEAFLCQETGWGWLRKIGASATAGQQRLRLRRGYAEPASKALLEREADLRQEELDEAAAAAPVSRLVLAVHGVGQKLAAANIAEDASQFRSVLCQVAADQAAAGALGAATTTGRCEVLPVQWRKHLQLDADALSRALMPPGIPSLRSVLHSTVVEILLFMTPHHRAEIIASLIASLNAAYARFLRRNPGFQGSVSILAHSLGSVLAYDILCCQPPQPPLGPGARQQQQQQQQQAEPMAVDADADAPLAVADSPAAALQAELARLRAENQRLQMQLEFARSPADPQQQQQQQQQQAQQQQQQARRSSQAGCGGSSAAVAWPPLQFRVDQLVLLGSPLGCFLALRGVQQAQGAGLGTAASAPLMQLAPGQPYTPDGLPAVNRLYNVFHPFDPVGHRLEPLALAPTALQRALHVPLFKGGKRIHLAVQEFSEDMGSAASRLGTTLLSSLAFAKFRQSKSFRAEAGSEEGAAAAAAAAAEAEAEAAAAAAAEVKAARRLPSQRSEPALAGGASGGGSPYAAGPEGALYASISFGAPGQGGSRLQSEQSEAPGAAASGSLSPTRRRQSAASGSSSSEACGGVARVAGGPPAAPGSKTAQGRLDFVMQESTLENQYLAALSAHFSYWQSPDIALFVLRAVMGLDVLTGAPTDAAAAAAAADAGGQQAQAAGQPPKLPEDVAALMGRAGTAGA